MRRRKKINKEMKALYENNFYTEQLPMRKWDSPFYVPNDNKLLFNILNNLKNKK